MFESHKGSQNNPVLSCRDALLQPIVTLDMEKVNTTVPSTVPIPTNSGGGSEVPHYGTHMHNSARNQIDSPPSGYDPTKRNPSQNNVVAAMPTLPNARYVSHSSMPSDTVSSSNSTISTSIMNNGATGVQTSQQPNSSHGSINTNNNQSDNQNSEDKVVPTKQRIVGYGVVKNVLSGDTIVILGKNTEKRLTISGIAAPKLANMRTRMEDE
uniref:Uncharacterized protein n=1 Tax=Lygus hesperus TaxID=30085 RepID=A0A0A9VTK8_LYGHE